jgi:hypothetical protein
MATSTGLSEAAVAAGVAFGIEPEVAEAVVRAYVDISRRSGRAHDPSTWSRTVWLAEADRWRRSPTKEAFFTLVLHLEELRAGWEAKATAGTRGWSAGPVGERLTKR